MRTKLLQILDKKAMTLFKTFRCHSERSEESNSLKLNSFFTSFRMTDHLIDEKPIALIKTFRCHSERSEESNSLKLNRFFTSFRMTVHLIDKKPIALIKTFLTAVIITFTLVSCEDAPPTDYIKENYIEAFLYVDHPIAGIKVLESQPVTRRFEYDSAVVKNADVRIITDNGTTLQLNYDFNKNTGYYYPDTNYRVEPNKLYRLEVRMPDGKIITGKTFTPTRFNWVKPPFITMQYPVDTMKLPSPDSLRIIWDSVATVDLFLLSVSCLDTVEYGKYLESPSQETNRRTYNMILSKHDEFYKDMTYWALIGSYKTPVVWAAFRWFGKHKIKIYAPDNNFLRWFQNIFFKQDSETDPLLNSVEGGMGVFGSASFIESDMMILKNQP